jgi:hypothetical protein
MPLLSRFLFNVIIAHLLHNGICRAWHRMPPPIPPSVTLHNWFISDWNKGVYPAPKRSRYKTKRHLIPDITPSDCTSFANTVASLQLPCDSPARQLEFDATTSQLHHVCPEWPRSESENRHLQAYLYSLTTPGNPAKVQFGSDTETICIDTGASACISRNKTNFLNLHSITNLTIKGIGTGLPIEGIGTLRWSIRDDANNEIDLYVKDALYVPAAPMGLLCPQQIAQQTGHSGDGFNALSPHGILTFEGYTKTIAYDTKSRLPIMNTIDGASAYSAITGPENTTLSKSQKLLLKWHQRLSHLHFGQIQDLARQGRLPKTLLGCDPPICKSCQYGKAHRRPVASAGKSQPIDANDLHPGDCVSVDQIESSEPGYVDIYSGKPTNAKYHAASLYTDHASRFMFLKCHYSTGSVEAIDGKRRFEQLASTYGIKIKAYRGDNGIMAKKDYIQHVEQNQQTITLAGVNNHSQNGIAERSIRTICDRARTMLLHAMEHWPDVIGLDLWPFALKLAVDVHNATPGPSGLSPEEIFSKQKARPDRLLDFHTFGCPVYVLDPRLQQGNKIPKWQPRSRQACYLGHSPRHAQTVPVVLNIRTGLCSPQYHVVFDDHFTTVHHSKSDSPPPQWSELFHHHRFNIFDGEPHIPDTIHLAPEWSPDYKTKAEEIPARPKKVQWGDITTFPTTSVSEGVTVTSEGAHTMPIDDATVRPSTRLEGAHTTEPNADATVGPSTNTEIESFGPPTEASSGTIPIYEDESVARNDTINMTETIPSASIRPGWNSSHTHNTRFKARLRANFACALATTNTSMAADTSSLRPIDHFHAMVSNMEQLQLQDDNTYNFHYPCAFATNMENDTLHYGEMLASDDRQDFAEAMQTEMDGLRDILEVVKRADLPANIKPLPAVWAFKRKRRPDWTIIKRKARINVHGGHQKLGINYWETYAPVVNWSTVRLTFILSLLKGFKAKQVDFIQAFTQAPLDCPIYMEIPAGYQVVDGQLKFAGVHFKNSDKTYVLKLLKNMYGLKQAGNNWYRHLTDDLLHLGFTQSRVDKCLFIRSDCIILIYVDDCLIFSPQQKTIDNIIHHLSTVFRITSEDDVGAYLGIDISRNEQGHLTLRQPGLIDKVIALCGLEHESNEHRTPADKILHSFMPDDTPRQYNWSYRQVIGVLNYIAASSRPDISFAVHQCARFSNSPTRTHELAVKRIIRYLKGTRDKGYILKPNGSDTIDCYVDADFAGAWTLSTSEDPSSVKSRSGYVITFAGCPILWSSKMQSEIALSTTEAEYISLSTSLRDLIPMRTIIQELSSICQISIASANTYSTVFEDNKGCVDLIAAPTMRPRTRHIAIKYHHFREHVRSGHIKIKWISTDDQLADIFTKPLPLQKFTTLRTKLLGW